ncbi:MAG: NUDIX hydrolase [bacterium]|nr:NUDIX hydrolase [bacterium]
MWQKKSSKVLLNHPRLTVIEDEIVLHTGKESKYLRLEHNANVASIIAIKGNNILLQKEYSYPVNKVLYQFPGGAVPMGEDISEGAQRELMEEVGLRAETLVPIGEYYLEHRRSDAKMYAFIGRDLVKEYREPDPEEKIESLWLTEDKIDLLIKQGEIVNSHTLACWSLFKAHKDATTYK